MISIELTLEEARVIYKNLKNHYINMDDQRIVYDFVHKLDFSINAEQQMTENNATRNVDK